MLSGIQRKGSPRKLFEAESLVRDLVGTFTCMPQIGNWINYNPTKQACASMNSAHTLCNRLTSTQIRSDSGFRNVLGGINCEVTPRRAAAATHAAILSRNRKSIYKRGKIRNQLKETTSLCCSCCADVASVASANL